MNDLLKVANKFIRRRITLRNLKSSCGALFARDLVDLPLAVERGHILGQRSLVHDVVLVLVLVVDLLELDGAIRALALEPEAVALVSADAGHLALRDADRVKRHLHFFPALLVPT